MGFRGTPLLDLLEVTQAHQRGRVWGVWVHLQDPLRAPPLAGFWVSATLSTQSWCVDSLAHFDPLCTINKLHSEHSFNDAFPDAFVPLSTSFQYLKSCVKHMQPPERLSG